MHRNAWGRELHHHERLHERKVAEETGSVRRQLSGAGRRYASRHAQGPGPCIATLAAALRTVLNRTQWLVLHPIVQRLKYAIELVPAHCQVVGAPWPAKGCRRCRHTQSLRPFQGYQARP